MELFPYRVSFYIRVCTLQSTHVLSRSGGCRSNSCGFWHSVLFFALRMWPKVFQSAACRSTTPEVFVLRLVLR